MSVVLAAEHLTKTFVSQGRENYTAVDDVSFSVESGEKLGIIGESGSGKTTVVNMITRLLDAFFRNDPAGWRRYHFKKRKRVKRSI